MSDADSCCCDTVTGGTRLCPIHNSIYDAYDAARDRIAELEAENARLRRERESAWDSKADVMLQRDQMRELLRERPKVKSIGGEQSDGQPASAEWVDTDKYIDWDNAVDAAIGEKDE